MMENIELTAAKYQRTLLGRVGGPEGPPTVVTCLKVGEQTVNIIMDVSDSKQMLYETLSALQTFDPVAGELYAAFKAIFQRKADERAKLQDDPGVGEEV